MADINDSDNSALDPQSAIASQGFSQLGRNLLDEGHSVAKAPQEGATPESHPFEQVPFMAGAALGKAGMSATEAIANGLSHSEFGEFLGNLAADEAGAATLTPGETSPTATWVNENPNNVSVPEGGTQLSPGRKMAYTPEQAGAFGQENPEIGGAFGKIAKKYGSTEIKDLLAQPDLTPQERALLTQRANKPKNYADGGGKTLPMDEASRLARAEKMGFDTSKTYYHGTKADIDAFKDAKVLNGQAYGKGIYLTERPQEASDYATGFTGSSTEDRSGSNVLPVHAKIENPFNLDAKVDPKLKDYALKNKIINKAQSDQIKDNFTLYGHLINKMQPSKFTELLEQHGYDAVQAPHAKTTVVFKPEQLRSKFAQFNPKQAKSSKLSYADGGEVEPEGLNEFLASPESQPGVVNPSEPEGLNEFLAPELKEAQYGTFGQQAKTALEGAAQGLVGPVAPAIERGLGVNPEDIRARAETNPMIHGASELGGLVAPAFATAGASLLERAGLGAAAEALPAVAKATQFGALEAIQAKLGLTAGETLASKIGTGAAKAAIDNMLISGSDETSKMILQDPNQSAQTAIANIGIAGVLGAALGGGLSGAGELWKAKVGDKASKLISDFKGRVQEHIDNPDPVNAMTNELRDYHKDVTSMADEVYGPTGLKAQDIEKSIPQMHEGIATQAQETLDKVTKQVNKMAEDPSAYPPRLTQRLQTDADAFTNAVTKPDANPKDIFNATQDLKQSLQGYAKYDRFVKPVDEAYDFVRDSKSLASDLRESLEDPKVWGDAAKRQQAINGAFKEYLPTLKDFEKKFTSELNGERVVDSSKVQTYLNQVGKPNAELKQSMLKNFLESSEKYKKVIDQSHSNLGLESPIKNSPMNTTLASLGKKTLGSKLADAFIKHGLTEGGGNAIGAGTGALLGHGLGIPSYIGGIIGQHALGPFFKSVLPGLAKAFTEKEATPAGIKAAIDYGTSVAKGQDLLTKASANLFKEGKDVIPESMIPGEKERARLDKHLLTIQKDPEKMLNQTDPLQHYLPNHANALNETTGTVVSYLNSIRPSTGKASPLDSTPVVNPVKKAAFDNAMQLAEQPLMILDRAKKGTLTSKDLAAMSAMYPSLLNNIRQNVMQSLTTHMSKGGMVPYSARLGLSLLMGQPLDSSMTAASIIAAQLPPSVPQQQPQQAQSKGVKSSPALQKMSGMYQTPSQSRQQRQNKE